MPNPSNNNEHRMETVGDRIRQLIEMAADQDRRAGKPRRHQMSERKLAPHVDVTPATVNNWVHSDKVDDRHLKRIANFFEREYGFTKGWRWLRDGRLATAHPPIDSDLLRSLIRVGREICEAERWPIADEDDLFDAACHEYSHVVDTGQIDYEHYRSTLRLTIKPRKR